LNVNIVHALKGIGCHFRNAVRAGAFQHALNSLFPFPQTVVSQFFFANQVYVMEIQPGAVLQAVLLISHFAQAWLAFADVLHALVNILDA
jgi:hypothetical protein